MERCCNKCEKKIKGKINCAVKQMSEIIKRDADRREKWKPTELDTSREMGQEVQMTNKE